MERTPSEYEQAAAAILAEQSRKQANTYSTFVCYCWLGAGAYLFYTIPSLSFISWQALVFVVTGMFLASGIIGGTFYLLGRLLAKATVKLVNVEAPPMAVLQCVSFALLFANLLVTYNAAKQVAVLLSGF